IDKVYTATTCIRGDVRFYSGFNAAIRQESFNNAIVFTGAVGAGEGEPCTAVPLFTGEVPPVGSSLLEGGPTCDEVVRTVNGVGGQFSFINANQGVTISNVPAEKKITINVNMSQLAICFGASFSEVSEAL